jgi:hypothetical protein
MPNTAPTVLAVLGALICASAFGVNLQQRLPERHKTRETGDHIRLMISILVPRHSDLDRLNPGSK